jgi:AcrR family transcriptional regulator
VRSRSERCRQEVLDVVVDLVGEVGVERVTIEEVALRSGVAKTTIYRHWPSKQALVVEAAATCLREVFTPNSGDLRLDLIACFEGFIRSSRNARLDPVYPALLAASRHDAELARLLRQFQDERRVPVITVLQLAQARGELPPDLDIALAASLLIGPIMYHKVVLHELVDRPFIEEVVDGVLGGIAAPVVVTR